MEHLVYLGVGGSGVKALLSLKKRFIETYGKVPPYVFLLAIDSDKSSSSKFLNSNNGVEIRLEPSELLICSGNKLTGKVNDFPQNYTWLSGNAISAIPALGSLGAPFASLGHFLAVEWSNIIEQRISDFFNQEKNQCKSGKVNIVASLAGGTGSGMLVDVLHIVNDLITKNNLPHTVTPWLLLPDVYNIFPDSSHTNRIYSNTYSILSVLDYLKSCYFAQFPIPYGDKTITEPLFTHAFLINNITKSGIHYNFREIIEELATSIWLYSILPLGPLPDLFYKIQLSGIYDIRNKRAWAASVGSAELIYDSQAVGRSYAYRIISQLCDSMLQSPIDGSADANKFFDDQNVMIRENNGRDDVIDSLMSPVPIYYLEITEDTTEQNVNFYLNQNYGHTVVEPELKANLIILLFV